MRFSFGAASALATGTFAAASLVTLRLGFAATDFGLAARALGAVPSGTGSAGGVSATAGLGPSETGEAGASAATGAGAALRLGFLAAGIGLTPTVLARVRRSGAGFAGAAPAPTGSGVSATGGAGASSAHVGVHLFRLQPGPHTIRPSLRAAEYHFGSI